MKILLSIFFSNKHQTPKILIFIIFFYQKLLSFKYSKNKIIQNIIENINKIIISTLNKIPNQQRFEFHYLSALIEAHTIIRRKLRYRSN
jgi:hypothetical protein